MDNHVKAGMLCPVCRVDLMMSDRQGIEIDYCPKCRGVWLDRGELDKIIERASVELSSGFDDRDDDRDFDRDRGFDRDYDDRGGYRKKRKRSFLSDMFEFGGD